MTSREFDQRIGAAEKAALNGPVYITHRGMPTHVLLSYEHYRELTKDNPSIADLLAGPPGSEDIELELPERTYDTRPPVFD